PCAFSLQPDFFASPDLQHDLSAEASLDAFLDEQHPADLDLDPQFEGMASSVVISGLMVVPQPPSHVANPVTQRNPVAAKKHTATTKQGRKRIDPSLISKFNP
ncbi:MAG: hypothetical protein ACKPAD_06105, partial [Bacteroidota bacterium]